MKKVQGQAFIYITETAYVVKIRKQKAEHQVSISKSFPFFEAKETKDKALIDAMDYRKNELESFKRFGVESKKNEEQLTLKIVLESYRQNEVLSLKGKDKEINKIDILQTTKLASIPISKLAQKDYDLLQNAMLKDGKANATIKRYENTITVAIKNYNRRYSTNIALPEFQPLKVANRKTDTISKEEFDEIMAHIQTEPTRTMIECLYSTGARRSEITDLKIEYLKEEDGLFSATLPTSKNDNPRHLFFNAYCTEKIKRQIANRKAGDVFLWRGEKVNKDLATRAWVRARNQASEKNPQLANYSIHTLRHSWITRLVNENPQMGMLEIMSYTGHKTVEMVARYFHNRKERMNKNIRAFLESDK